MPLEIKNIHKCIRMLGQCISCLNLHYGIVMISMDQSKDNNVECSRVIQLLFNSFGSGVLISAVMILKTQKLQSHIMIQDKGIAKSKLTA